MNLRGSLHYAQSAPVFFIHQPIGTRISRLQITLFIFNFSRGVSS